MIIPCKIGGVVTIGYEGENNAREYHFDITRYRQAWPEGTPQILVTRSDGENYIAETSVDDTALVWIIKRSDLACPGQGSMIIAFVNDQNELLGYTETTTLIVEEMPEWLTTENPPASYEPWIASVLLAGDAAKTAAAQAEQSAEAAAASAEAASANAEAASASAEAAAQQAQAGTAAAATATAAAETAQQARQSAEGAAATATAKAGEAVSSATLSAQAKTGAESAATAAAESAANAAASAASIATSAAESAADALAAKNAKNSAENAAESAAESAENSAASALSAQASANAAAASVAGGGYVFFEIDETGHLNMTKSENVESLDFRLTNGRLEVIYG